MSAKLKSSEVRAIQREFEAFCKIIGKLPLESLWDAECDELSDKYGLDNSNNGAWL